VIEFQNLTKIYGGSTLAVDDVSFRVNEGEILGFLGPNGAGKTTTMRILTTFLPATNGTAKVAGFDVFEQPMEVKKRLGYLPENPPLYDDMTVKEYLQFAAEIKNIPAKAITGKIEKVLDRIALKTMENRMIKKLSKGFRQRVGIAQALIHDPAVLVLDEPTIGLDPAQIREVRGLIKDLANDHTVILSTHILPEVEMTCDRFIIIADGKIVAEDSMGNVRNNANQPDLISLIADGPADAIKEKLMAISGTKNIQIQPNENGVSAMEISFEPGTDTRKTVAKTIHENGWGLLEMKSKTHSLEDIFLRAISQEKEVDNA